MECGREAWVRGSTRVQAEKWQRERKSLFEKYIEELSTSMASLTGVDRDKIRKHFYETMPNYVKLAAPTSEPPPPGDPQPEAASDEAASFEAEADEEAR